MREIMSKLYYKDPLAAAYMAREFGVKFDIPNSPTPLAMRREGKYYIHPDSYHVFEPRVGDLVAYGWVSTPCQLIGKVTNEAIFNAHGVPIERDKYRKIIQRKGKPFFMRKEEI